MTMPVLHLVELVLGDRGPHGDAVGLGHVAGGMGHPVGELPVVGEQQQPLGILVQTAHGVDTLPHVLHQLGHALAAPLVVEGGDEPPGLVQRQVDFLLAFA